jgi:hypothetical protein
MSANSASVVQHLDDLGRNYGRWRKVLDISMRLIPESEDV